MLTDSGNLNGQAEVVRSDEVTDGGRYRLSNGQ